MRVYFIAMTIRIACVASLFFVRGWWILLVGIAVVVLPYFAVLVANQHAPSEGARPERPGPLELEGGDEAEKDPGSERAVSQELLIVDAPAERRAGGGASSRSAAHSEAPEPGSASDRAAGGRAGSGSAAGGAGA